MPDSLLKQIDIEIQKREKLGEPEQQEPQVALISRIDEEIQRREDLEANKTLGDSALEVAGDVGKAFDVLGAPTRSALMSAAQGKGLGSSFGEFAKQIGEDPTLAPTGKQIAEEVGLSGEGFAGEPQQKFVSLESSQEEIDDLSDTDRQLVEEGFKVQVEIPQLIRKGDPLDISPAGAVGLGVDILADPLAFIPIGKVAKGISKAGVGASKKAGQMALAGSVKAAEAALPAGVKQTMGAVGRSGKSVKKAIDTIFNPKVATDFKKFKKIAEQAGIDPKILPESVEFGKESFLSRQARNIAEGPLGQEKLQKFNTAVDSVSDALNKNVKSLGGSDEVLSAVDAGKLIRESYDDSVKTFFEKMNITYDSIIENNPGLRFDEKSMSKINHELGTIEKFAKDRLSRRGISATKRSQGKELLNSIKAIKENDGTFKQMTEALQDIGEEAFQAKNSLAEVPSDIENLRKIYSSLRGEIVETVRKNLGDRAAKDLIKNNVAMNQFFGRQSLLAKIIGNKQTSPERVFKQIIQSGDTRKIDALKSIIKPEQFNALKASFLDSIIKRNIDGDVIFRSSFNSMRSKKGVISEIFNPNEVEKITDLLKLGDRIGEPVLSRSGTGASNLFKDIGSTIRATVENEALLTQLKERARRGTLTASKLAETFKKNGLTPLSKTENQALLKELSKGVKPKLRTGIGAAKKAKKGFITPRTKRLGKGIGKSLQVKSVQDDE